MGQSNFKNGVALFALAAVSSLGMVQTAHADPTTKWNGSPETREDDRRFHVSGRFMYDVNYANQDYLTQTAAGTGATAVNESGIRTYARRLFLGVDGRLSEHWRYNVKFDLTPSAGSVKNSDDMYLEYADNWGSIFVGQNNAVSPMEDRDSSLNIPFNERSFLISASGVGKKPGIAFLTNGGNWSAGVAVASQDGLNADDTSTNGAEAYFGAARLTWAPIYQQTPEGTTLLHLGVYGRYRDVGGGNNNGLIGQTTGSLYSINPGGPNNKTTYNAGVGAFDHDQYLSFEIAGQYNSFGFEAEYGQMDTHDYAGGDTGATAAVNRTQAGDASANGYYVDLFWSPTGESRNYKAADGSFGAITPIRPLGSGGFGHVMLGARYENLDLTDDNFKGIRSTPASPVSLTNATPDNRSEITSYTLGVTWVPIEHVKFQLNYSSTEVDYVNNTVDVSNTAGTQLNRDNTFDAITLRTQFDW